MTVLFFLQLKRALKAVPRLIAGAILPLFLAGMAIFFAQRHYSETTGTSTAPIALVNHDAKRYLDFLLPLITETEAASSFSFLPMEEKEAMTALQNNTVCAVLVFPKEMFSGILDSTNIPARLYLADGNSFSSLLVAKYAEAGSLTLGSSQAAIYTAADLYYEYGISDHLSDLFIDINAANLKYALNREAAFSTKAAAATGTLSLLEYYGCTLLVCLFLFFGAGMGSFLTTPAPKTFSDQLHRNGMGAFLLEASLFLPLVLFYLCYIVLLYGVASAFLPSLCFTSSSVLFLVCMAFCFAACTQLIFFLFGNAGRGLLGFCFFGLLMVLIGGGFLPFAFLPRLFSTLTPFLPLSACLMELRRLVGDALTLSDSLFLIVHTVVMLFLLGILSFVRRREGEE